MSAVINRQGRGTFSGKKVPKTIQEDEKARKNKYGSRASAQWGQKGRAAQRAQLSGNLTALCPAGLLIRDKIFRHDKIHTRTHTKRARARVN